jgi:hypothetical protein
MEIKKLAEARIRYNQLSGNPTNNRDLLLMELPKEKFDNLGSEEYINMINDLSEDDDINQYLSNKYQEAINT